ncbi:MAG: alpha/beta hydrolase [Bacteroidota bacterium]
MKILKKIAWTLIVIIMILGILIGSQVKFDVPVETLKAEYANEQSQFMTINGMEVHFRDEGNGEPLVLLHGTAASLHTWDGWTEALKDSFRVIRLDLPAFGLTGPDPDHDYSIDNYIAVLNTFFDQLRLDSLTIAGNSFGGRIAIDYTLRHSDKVKKLILVDASWYKLEGEGAPSLGFKLAKHPILSRLVRWTTTRSLVKKSVYEVYGDDSKVTDDVIDRYYDMLLRQGNRAAFVGRVNTDYVDNNPAIKSIAQPTLILWGDQDIWTPTSHAPLFERDIEGAKLIMYEGVGHIPMEEIPEQSAEDVRRFLEERK